MAATTDLATIRNEPANGSATPGSENGDEKINPGNIPPDLTTIFLRSALTEERLELIFRWYFFLTSDLTRINFEDLEGPWDIPELRERGVADQSLYIDCEGGPMFSIPYYNLLTGGQTREPLNGLINDPIKAGTRLRELWTAPFGKLQTSEPTDPTFKWISRPTPPVIFGASYSQDGNRTVFYRPPPGSRNLPNPPLTQRPSHGTIWAGTIYDDYSRDFMHPTQLKWQVLPLSLLLPLSNACQSIGLYHPAEIIGDADHLSVKNPLAFGFRLLETFSDPGSDYNKRRAMCVRLSHGPALQHRHPFEAILQFHIRHLERANTFGWYKRPPGINLERMQVRIPRVTGEGFIWLSERVTSLSVSVLNTDEAPYKIVILGENPVPGGNLGRKKVLDAETDNRNELAFYLDSVLPAHSDLDERGMRSCDRCFGIVQFQLSFLKSLVNWERMWIQTLRDIDKAAEFRLQSTLNDAELDEYMFDDSFQRSRCYFTILQVLRVSSDMVEEVMTDWTELQDKWNLVIKQVNMFSTEDLQALDHNWNIVAGIISSKTNRILARINQKTEEIKSLRDGLFNATSLREATKGIALNRAIYVFTVVTVIYTPIGFLAAFWALPFLESSNNAHAANPTSQTAQPGQQSQNSSIATTLPTGFIATFIIVPLLTYGLCVIIAYFLGYSAKERQALRVRGVRFVKNLKHQPGKLGRKAARYFLYLNSWRRGKTESTESSITDNDSYAS